MWHLVIYYTPHTPVLYFKSKMWKLFELLFHIQNKKSERLNLFNSKKNITENPLMLKYDNKEKPAEYILTRSA